MNTLELRVEPLDDSGFSTVRVLIDGRDLVDLVRSIEAPFAHAEGHPSLAGAYLGLDPAEWNELPERYGDGRVAVLGCECGVAACWPLRVRIVVTDDRVVWSDFEQPYRESWGYSGLGPFTFDRRQYETELAKVGASAT